MEIQEREEVVKRKEDKRNSLHKLIVEVKQNEKKSSDKRV